MHRIFLLFKHPIFCEGIEGLLKKSGGIQIVGRESDIEEAEGKIRELKPNVIIVENGEDEHHNTSILIGLTKAGLKVRIIGLNLKENTVTVYRGERLVIREVEDLMDAIEQNVFNQGFLDKLELANLATSRSRVYGFLSAIYNRLPTDLFVENLFGNKIGFYLASLMEAEDLPDELRAGLQLIQDYVSVSHGKSVEELRTELAVDRTRLLRGVKPGYGPPPPYESVYRGTESQPLMNCWSAVQRIYAEAGVDLPEEVKDRPDFIGIELDFMRYLTEKEAEAWSSGEQQEALDIAEKEQAFLAEHISEWIPRFCEVMYQEARLDFFRGIAKMTRGFVLSETEKVAELRQTAA